MTKEEAIKIVEEIKEGSQDCLNIEKKKKSQTKKK